MKGTHSYTKITFIVLFVFLLLQYILFPEIMDKYYGVLFVLMMGGLIVAQGVDFYLDVISKPVIYSKAKVISKRIYTTGDIRYATFLFADKNTLELEVTKKQYKSISENDIVNLEYQGYIVNSVEKISKGNKVNSKSNK